MTDEFKDIRPYQTREEILEAIHRIQKNDEFRNFSKQMFAGNTLNKKFEELSKIGTTTEFQSVIILPLLQKLVMETSNGIEVNGIEHLEKDKAYLFISNHRDIIMDSALLQYILITNEFKTTEIAIGSNLLIYQWITDLVKINKSFVVKRDNVGVRDQLTNAKQLSAYIHDTIVNRKESIWLAQREGRTKDGIDQTQISLLKMLNLSGKGSVIENFTDLSIVPISISYEYEPCDGLKTRELYMNTTPEGYTKTKEDDLLSMFLGLKQQKGRIHYEIGKPITSSTLNSFDTSLSTIEFIENLAAIMDKHIISNFKLFPDNYIALDLLNDNKNNDSQYTFEEKELFLKHMNRKLEEIEGNTPLHREIFLKIYANPILNKKQYEL